jgi:hypothetical protein
VPDGVDEPSDEPVDEPLAALPAGPRPALDGSGWGINWWGFVPLAIVGVLAFVAFRTVGFGGGEAEGAAAVDTDRTTTTTTLRPRPTTTTTRPTTTTVSPTTTVPPTTAPTGPVVRAWGEVKPCRFGDACLAVSFTIEGFPEPVPTSFQCIYPNSTRQFSFDGTGEVEACLTGDEGDVVYIDVDGVRSSPVSATNLNP